MSIHAVYTVIRTENLEHALSVFRRRFGADPAAVIVNAQLVTQIEAELDGKQISVSANGGALLGEIWFERPAVDTQAAAESLRSLTARISEAQRSGSRMTMEQARQLALEMEMERV